jgi:hypothetical protein
MKFKVQFEFSEFQLQQLVLYPNLFWRTNFVSAWHTDTSSAEKSKLCLIDICREIGVRKPGLQ